MAIDEPQFEYDAETGKRSLLLEPSRTNLLTYSEQFDNAAWSKGTDASISANAATAADGTTTADQIVVAATATASLIGANYFYGTNFRVVEAFTATIGEDYTSSFFVEYDPAGDFDLVQVRVSSSATLTGGTNALFSLITGEQLTGSTDVTATRFANGWRFSLTAEADATTMYTGIWGWATTSFTPNGTSGYLLWGAQLEEGSYPTSYIGETLGAAVTRTGADTSVPVDEWYGSSKGTLILSLDMPEIGETGILATLGDASGDSQYAIFRTNAGEIQANIDTGDNAILDPSVVVGAGRLLVAFSYNDDSISLAVNGSYITDTHTGVIPNALGLFIGRRSTANTGQPAAGYSRLRYFADDTDEAELIALTTPTEA